MSAMRFYDLGGQVYCKACRDDILTNAWRVNVGYTDTGHQVVAMSDEPPLRPRSFEALGDRPWAGNGDPERYVQCDGCMESWGPDA